MKYHTKDLRVTVLNQTWVSEVKTIQRLAMLELSTLASRPETRIETLRLLRLEMPRTTVKYKTSGDSLTELIIIVEKLDKVPSIISTVARRSEFFCRLWKSEYIGIVSCVRNKSYMGKYFFICKWTLINLLFWHPFSLVWFYYLNLFASFYFLCLLWSPCSSIKQYIVINNENCEMCSVFQIY